MNDHEQRTTLLLQQATSDLAPDVDRLVGGAITRGRSLQRRHRVRNSLVAAAVVGVIGTAASVPPVIDRVRGGDTTVAVDPPATGAPKGPAPLAEPGPRRVGIDDAKTAAVLESLLPDGDVADRDVWHGRGFQGGRLLVDGALVTMLIESPDGGATPDPAACAELPPAAECQRLANGDAIITMTIEESVQGQPNGIMSSSVSIVTVDGFALTATAYNAPGEKYVDPVAEAPVLSEKQLTGIVLDPVWLDEQQ